MLRLVLAFIAILGAELAQAQNAEGDVRVGVLAYRGLEPAQTTWNGLGEYLTRTVPGHRFSIVPVTLSSAQAKIENGEIEFLVTNPGHFVELSRDHPMSALASRLVTAPDGRETDRFGSAIITRRDSGIEVLRDAVGRKVVAVDRDAFGGFRVAWRAFDRAGVDLFSDSEALIFTGFPMDQVVDHVLSGKAAIGIVRSGLIEELALADPGIADSLTVLNAGTSGDHPNAVSTALYPEWPFCAPASTPRDLRDQVALALLSSRHSPVAAEVGLGAHWTSPVSYHSVHGLSDAYRGRIAQLETAGTRRGQIGWALLAAVAGGALVLVLMRVRQPAPAADEPADSGEPDGNAPALTAREKQVLDLIARGRSTKEIAQELGISPKTVEFHRANLLKKYSARTSSQLVALAT